MKATGIIRRIDELGRVVIPKGIRKTLRLRVGDPLEIYTDSGELLLKKYSALSSIENFSKDICETINFQTDKLCIICDMDEVVFAKGGGSKEFEKKPISQDLENAIISRRAVFRCKGLGDSLLKITFGETQDYSCQYIVPIVSGGDTLGAIILLSKTEKISATEMEICRFCQDFLQRQFV